MFKFLVPFRFSKSAFCLSTSPKAPCWRFPILAMTMSEQARHCSFGLTKTFFFRSSKSAFSRHDNVRASSTLFIWLNENVLFRFSKSAFCLSTSLKAPCWRFPILAMTMPEQARHCSFGLTKTLMLCATPNDLQNCHLPTLTQRERQSPQANEHAYLPFARASNGASSSAHVWLRHRKESLPTG